MANVVIKSSVAATYNDAWVHTAVCAENIDNGCVFKLDSYSTNEGEVFVWEASQAAETDSGLWMAISDNLVMTQVAPGLNIRGLTPDPRAFVNIAGSMIDAILLHKEDIIEMTGDGIADVATSDYLVPDATGFKLKGAAAAGTGLTLRKVGTSRLHIASADIVKPVVPTYKYKVVNN